jgi:hypothetical protein
MKLSEGLIHVSDINKKITELKERLLISGKIQEGDVPTDDVTQIFTELHTLHEQLTVLTKQISKTNYSTKFDAVRSIQDALIEKEILGKEIAGLKFAIDNCQIKHDRYSQSEIKMITTFDIKKTRETNEELMKKRKELDLKIQQINWNTEVLN